jgi:hypothetical protein
MRKSLIFALLAMSFCLVGFTKEEAVKSLKEKKIEVNDQSFRDAFKKQDVALMDLLVDAGINVNIKSEKDFPIFVNMIIASGENIPLKDECKELAIKMIKMGANVNSPPKKGDFSPLMYAAMSRAYEIVELLIARGADVNFKAENDETPLLGAVMVEDVKMARILLSKGAKKTGTGVMTKFTAFEEYVKDTENAELIALLAPPKTKTQKVVTAAGDTLLFAGIMGFFFGGFSGIFKGMLMVVVGVVAIIFFIGMGMIFIGGLFGAASESLADSKKFNILLPFEKVLSLLPGIKKTLQEEKAFKAKMDKKYPQKNQTETKEE